MRPNFKVTNAFFSYKLVPKQCTRPKKITNTNNFKLCKLTLSCHLIKKTKNTHMIYQKKKDGTFYVLKTKRKNPNNMKLIEKMYEREKEASWKPNTGQIKLFLPIKRLRPPTLSFSVLLLPIAPS